jgi:hypothetical protein
MINIFINPAKYDPIILTPVGDDPKDITSLFREINIYENIFTNFLSGDMTLIDTPATRLIEQGLIGIGDLIEFSFAGKTEDGSTAEKAINIKMKIYKFETSAPSGFTGQAVKIYFSSSEFLENKNNAISTLYDGNISDIITKIIKKLHVSESNLEIESCDQKIKLVVPYDNPMTQINNLVKRMGKGNDFNYVFYQTIDGKYKLTSVASLMKKQSNWGTDSKTGFVVLPGGVEADGNLMKRMCITHAASQMSPIENAHNGMVSSSVLTIDTTTKNHIETTYSLKDDYSKQTHISKEALVDVESEYMTKTIDGPVISFIRTKAKGLFDCKETDDGQDQIGGEKDWFLKRKSQIEQLNQLSITFFISGNSLIRAGDTFFFGRPVQQSLSQEAGNTKKDFKYNGKYLCSSIKHTLFFNKENSVQYMTQIKGIKDSKGDE